MQCAQTNNKRTSERHLTRKASTRPKRNCQVRGIKRKKHSAEPITPWLVSELAQAHTEHKDQTDHNRIDRSVSRTQLGLVQRHNQHCHSRHSKSRRSPPHCRCHWVFACPTFHD